MLKRLICLAALFAMASFLMGCGLFTRENRPTLNVLDRTVEKAELAKSPATQIALFPVALPVGVTAGVVDAFVFIPAFSAQKAFCDTAAVVWENPQGSDFRQAMLIVPKIAITPVFFVGDWLATSLFHIREIKPVRGAICGK
ncbi:MAG: hypothetical protein A4E66_01329 [Syntrophus sp. PtaB.Bin001]|jgi:hypothetical protein|nr:MAG: hypothetical protein A4E66_01329 [Syntrophus sp. PtaB.Bin001]